MGVKKTTAKAEKKTGSINTNVILTEFEKDMLVKLSTTDGEDGEHTVKISDIYGMVKYDSVNEDGETINNKFLSMQGRFKNSAGIGLNVTVVVVNDKRFYMTLGNQEIKERTGKDLFVNSIDNMRAILSNMSGSFMSDADVEKEADDINNFGAL